MSCVLVTLVPESQPQDERMPLSGVDRPGLCLSFVEAPSLEAGGLPACGDLQSESLIHPGLSCRRTDDSAAWVPHLEKSAAGRGSKSHLIQVKTAARKARDGVTGSAHTQETPVLPAFHFSCASTARVRFPDLSPHTCTWAAPPPSRGVLPKTRR